ncbi:exopolysaccharide biosynthesis polyprenyl glycosylphosphotransferase [Sneathia sanguinegens]|uniref:exopolysaccharide biosynthesis polyprenyl glycosylphosphotransferase n=1 Tax=Sneathia sanguinegens TaxID=40543 RepID=UPI0035C70A81
MKKIINRNSYRLLFITLNILVIILAQFLINKPINLDILLYIVICFPFYYILNIFNFEYRIYDLKQIVICMLANFFLMLLFDLTVFYQVMEGIIFFFVIMFYQIVVKFLMIVNLNRKDRVILIGTNEYKDEIINEMKNTKLYKIILDTNDKDKLIEAINQNQETMIIDFDSGFLDDPVMSDMFLKCKISGVKIYTDITFYEIVLKKLAIKRLHKKYFVVESGFSSYQDTIKKNIKRIFDICFAIIILIPAIPLMLISAIIIKLESRGPIIYAQERIGENNKAFKIYKFRSMRTNSEKDGPKWAKENDNRVTKFGKIMRKTRIDELPQLYNVIRGQMSFVGPRPERQFFINTLEKEIPYYNLRHIVKPGLTGWAQVKYPYGASVEDAYRKLQYDLYYIKNYSLTLDILIILDTVKIVIFGKGR